MEASVWAERMVSAVDNGVEGGRWYSLMDKVWAPATLAVAWAKVRANKGAAGVDGVSVERFAVRSEAYLAEPSAELRTGSYRPQPVKRVEIAKGDGPARPLGIPAVKERIVQAAMKLVTEPIFEADFEDRAYGYRPRRSAIDAVKEAHRLLCRGYTDVIDADLSKYFESIPHADLLRSVARRIVGRHVLWLIKSWLGAPVEERDGDGRQRMSGGKSNKSGTPQGGVASLGLPRFRGGVRAWVQGI